MAFHLRDGALLAVGTGVQPVDLVLPGSRLRLPLSGEEASVAMLLIEAATTEEELIGLAAQNGVRWSLEQLGRFLEKLTAAGLVRWVDLPELEQSSASVPPWDEGKTLVFGGRNLPLAVQHPASTPAPDRPVHVLQTGPGQVPPLEDTSGGPEPIQRKASVAPQPAPEPRPAEPSLQPLVLAARLMGEGKDRDAALIIEAVLAADPRNPHARAMYDLVSPSKSDRLPRGLLIVAIVLLVLTLGVTLFQLFR